MPRLKPFIAVIALGGLLLSSLPVQAALPLHVLFLGRNGNDQRTREFVDFLSLTFEQCTTVPRDDFRRDLLQGIDVVLMDWSQQERTSTKYDSPVGPLESWETPTVFLGSAGLIMAGPWNVLGGAG